ncbi:MAG: response regulator transcription factor [Sarcina sp.]
MINLILVDDQKIIREGLKMILSLDEEINILAEGNNGDEALKLCALHNPDLVLMDIRMPVKDGIVATLEIKENFPNIKVLILTTFNDNDYIFDTLKNGASGYLLKDADPDEIISAVKSVYKGNMLIHPDIAAKLATVLNSKSKNKEPEKVLNLNSLTDREKEVALLVARGLTNKDICAKLFLSEGTVKNYVSKILDKLELENRTELAILIN